MARIVWEEAADSTTEWLALLDAAHLAIGTRYRNSDVCSLVCARLSLTHGHDAISTHTQVLTCIHGSTDIESPTCIQALTAPR